MEGGKLGRVVNKIVPVASLSDVVNRPISS